jgi:hypothetical protein
MAAVTACTAPGQYGASIPIDHAGLPGRWRRACELGKVSSTEGSCGKGDVEVPDSDESEPESSVNRVDADASYGYGASDDDDATDGSVAESIEPARDRP